MPVFDVVRIGYRQGESAARLTQFPPGAPSATSGPRFENPTLVPTCLSPATAMTPLQFAGADTAWPALLPAEMTITAPVATTSLTAS